MSSLSERPFFGAIRSRVPGRMYTHPKVREVIRYPGSSVEYGGYRDRGFGGGCHNVGVARMCTRPGDGVRNKWGQTHDIPNLFVSDGSVFSSSAVVNSTLTIVALAIRQAEHIAGQMARREL